MSDGSTASIAMAKPAVDSSSQTSNIIHFPTLAIAVTVAAAMVGWLKVDLSAHQEQLSQISARISELPTKSELDREVERAVAVQKAEFQTQAARVGVLADETQKGLDTLQERTDRRLDMLDSRIASLGTDFSGALIEYLRTGRQGSIVAGDGGSGGADGEEELYRDYGIRLSVRDANLSLADATKLVDHALLDPSSDEGLRLMELAAQARVHGRGVVAD